MGKNIVVENCSFSFSFGTGNVSIISTASQNVKCSGKGVYLSPLRIQVSNFTDEETIAEGTGTGSIVSTATKTKSVLKAVMLEGDQVTVPLIGVNPESGVEVTSSVVVTISAAGQSEVKAI